MNRTGEFVIGLIGGIFGLFSAAYVLLIGNIGSVFTGTNDLAGLAVLTLAGSVLGIFGSVTVKNNAKKGGLLMLIGAVAGFIGSSGSYLIPGVLLVVASLMAFFRN